MKHDSKNRTFALFLIFLLLISFFTQFLTINIKAEDVVDKDVYPLENLTMDLNSEISFINEEDNKIFSTTLKNLNDIKFTTTKIKTENQSVAEYSYVNLDLIYYHQDFEKFDNVLVTSVLTVDGNPYSKIFNEKSIEVNTNEKTVTLNIKNLNFSKIQSNEINIETEFLGEDDNYIYAGSAILKIKFSENLDEDENNNQNENNNQENNNTITTPNYIESELRRSSGSPLIRFKNSSGKIIKLDNGDEWVLLGDNDLKFNSTSFTYKNSETYNYKSADLYFSYIDYSCTLPKENISAKSIDIFGEIIDESMVAELELGGNILAADIIECERSSKNNPQFKIYYKDVDCFSDFDNQAQLYVRYQIKNGEDVFPQIYKGSIDYEFTNLELTEKVEKNEEITVNLVQPEKDSSTTNSSETKIKTTTPFVLINKCILENGKNFVTAGEKFNINISFSNTHQKQDLENVLLQIDVSSEFILENSVNTFLIGDISNGKTLSKTLTFSVNPTADVKNYSIPITFSYEYVDDGSRKEDKLTQEIVIPVKQNIRFQAANLDFMPSYETERDVSINSAYANLSKTKIYNVKAVLETEIFSNQKVIYIGNLNAGEGGSAKFTLKSLEEGKKALKVTYFYEDEVGNQFKYETSGEMNFVLPPAVEETQEKEFIVIPSENSQPTVTYIEKTPQENQNKLNSSEVVIIALGTALFGGLFVYAKMSNKIKPHK